MLPLYIFITTVKVNLPFRLSSHAVYPGSNLGEVEIFRRTYTILNFVVTGQAHIMSLGQKSSYFGPVSCDQWRPGDIKVNDIRN